MDSLGRRSRYARFADLVGRRHAVLGIAALAFVLSLPAIASGLMADDFDLALAVSRDPLAAYAFWSRDPAERRHHVLSAREDGTAPWWIDLDMHQAFLRPLS